MVLFYFLAGANHVRAPEFYLKFLPPYLPFHLGLIYVSGVAEIVCALLLIPMSTRKWASWAIIILLISFFPANIYTLTTNVAGLDVTIWFLWLRIPIQFLFMAWAWWHSREAHTI